MAKILMEQQQPRAGANCKFYLRTEVVFIGQFKSETVNYPAYVVGEKNSPHYYEKDNFSRIKEWEYI